MPTPDRWTRATALVLTLILALTACGSPPTPTDIWYQTSEINRDSFISGELHDRLGGPSVPLGEPGPIKIVRDGATTYANPLGESVPLIIRAPGGHRFSGAITDAPRGRGLVVALHQTNLNGAAEPCGDQPAGEQAYGTYFAVQGYLVVCPTLSFTGDRQTADQWDTTQFYVDYPFWTAMGKDITEVSWLLDALEQADVSLDDVSLIGHSQGAIYSLYAAAVDDRVTRVISNAGYVDTLLDPQPERWSRPSWYRGFSELPSGLDLLEVVAAIAPRCALLINYTEDVVLVATSPSPGRLAEFQATFPSITWVFASGKHAWLEPQLVAAANWLADQTDRCRSS